MKPIVDKYLGYSLIFILVFMTLDVLWGVLTRYLLGHQADWTEELARFLLIWIGVLGAAFASGQKMHLAIDLLPSKLSLKRQHRLTQTIAMLVLFFALAVLIIGGIRLVYITQILQQHSAALQIPMAVVYAVLPISGLLIIYYQLHFVRSARPPHG